MKVTYLKLENVAGLMVGSNMSSIEISFEKSKNKIVAIQGPNGTGKSVLLSTISPFPGVTSIDDRSSLSFFIPKKNGYKEIHYLIGEDKFVIKIYAKASKDTHTFKCYITMNGVELNENGNVRSFLALVEEHFGVTEEMMRLIRLGSNLNSFITLTPAKRKEYIGGLIEEINAYLIIHKTINDDLKVCKSLMNVNASNLYNCHIQDIVVEEAKLDDLADKLSEYEKDKDKINKKIGKLQALMSSNDIDELRKKQNEAKSSIDEFNRIEDQIESMSLKNMTVEQLIKRRSNLSDSKISVQAKIHSYRISIDNALKNIERLELSIKKITSNNDVDSLIDAIAELKGKIAYSTQLLDKFTASISSEDVQFMLSKLSSFNQISQMIYTFGNKPIDVYIQLIREGKSVDRFLKDQAKKSMNRLNQNDMKILFDKIFQNEDMITPNCDTEYKECPYYRLADVITDVKSKLEEESFDDETLRYIQLISNNIDNILNEIEMFYSYKIPERLKEGLKEKIIIQRMEKHLPFFDLSELQDYLSYVREYEIHTANESKLKDYEYQLSIYKKSGIDNQMEEINELQKNINFYNNNIDTLSKEIKGINNDLELVDTQITLVSRYNDSKKYKKMFQSTLDSTTKLLVPLESASNEKKELEFELRNTISLIDQTRNSHKELESKINEYKKLVEEGERLAKRHRHLSMILKSVSTKEGMPVKHMKRYLGKIRMLANNLLKIIYNDNLKLARFKLDQDSFEIPYIKNDRKISDIKYSSQSEKALTTMALSFALANEASASYNILSLDEIDAGLDEENRSKFLKMLYIQISALKAEQVFIISHNMSQMVNIPMDCIRLSNDVKTHSKLQNVIFEAV